MMFLRMHESKTTRKKNVSFSNLAERQNGRINNLFVFTIESEGERERGREKDQENGDERNWILTISTMRSV